MATANIQKHLCADIDESDVAHNGTDTTTATTIARVPVGNSNVRKFGGTLSGQISSQFRLRCVQESSLFRDLTPAQCAQVTAMAREVHFRNRETVFREGDQADTVLVLAKGRVKMTQLSRSGSEVIFRLKGTGEVLGGLGVEPGGVHLLSAQTLDSCVVLAWDGQKFAALEDRFPALRRNTVLILAERLRALEQRFLGLATEQVGPRLAQLLVSLAEPSRTSNEPSVRIELSREELAQMTGTTLFTVSRFLSDWEQRGIIQTQRKAVTVRNRAQLIRLIDSAEQMV